MPTSTSPYSDRLAQLTSEEFQQYVLNNENADVQQLLLGSVPENIEAKEAADQILSRRKAKGKLPGWLALAGLVFPPPLSIEQSSSERAATYKTGILGGEHIVDLTGGMGVDLLALSPQFQSATHVEIDPWLSAVFKHNAGLLSSNPIEAVNQSAEQFLEKFEGKATFFIDPARRDNSKKKVFQFADCQPNVIELLPHFREKAEKVLVKAAPMIDLHLGIAQLEHVSQVHVVSIHNECKEVLFLMDFDFQGEPEIHCVNLRADECDEFTFTLKQERELSVKFGAVEKYLHEPNASVRKAGAFKSIAAKYGLTKIAPNTHLYTTGELVPGFPGRIFEVASEVNKKSIKSHFPDGKANVIAKNHPLSAEQLKKKFGLKDGGEKYLIGFRDSQNKVQNVGAVRV